MPTELNRDYLVSDVIISMLNGYNTGISKDQFYANNIVDATDVTETDMKSINAEVVQYCRENGCYAALPPFEEGSYIDQSERRFVYWKVQDIHEDYFYISFDHYPIIYFSSDTDDVKIDFTQARSRCWYKSCHTLVKVKPLTEEEHMTMLGYLYEADYGRVIDDREVLRKASRTVRGSYHLGGVIEHVDDYLAKDYQKIKKKGKYYTSDGILVNGSWVKDSVDTAIKQTSLSGLGSILFSSAGPIIEMFVYINYLFSQKSTSSSTLRTINSVYIPGVETLETRKERHFGKVKVISEKKPRAVNATNIQRVYTTISWQRRSHIRHLPSGKIVPVKSAVCKRHNLGEDIAPQVIYKV